MNSVKKALQDALTDNSLIDKYVGKIGLDIEEGRFRVKGTLTLGKVFKRRNVGTNLALSAGYIIEDCVTGDTLVVEKQQGVRLCGVYGMCNAFISYRGWNRTSKEGEVLQKRPSVYLQPYPQRTEAFTQDERIRTAFKLDAEGNLVRPFVLNITEEECTPEMWNVVQQQFKKGSKVSKRTRRGREEQHEEKMAHIRQALRAQDVIFSQRKGREE